MGLSPETSEKSEGRGTLALVSSRCWIGICGTGVEGSPWRTDYDVSGGAFRGVTKQQLLVIVNPKNPHFSRFVRKIEDSETNGKIRVRFADDRDDRNIGDVHLFQFPKDDQVFEVYVKEIRALLSDFNHYLWVEQDQMRVILQAVQANTKRTVSVVWSWPKVRLAWRRRLQQAWKRYRNKRRIQYRKQIRKDPPIEESVSLSCVPGDSVRKPRKKHGLKVTFNEIVLLRSI
jgi:hypothetical protein